MTLETEVANLVAATTELTAAVNVKKSALDAAVDEAAGSVTAAQAHANNAAASAGTVNGVQTAVAASAATATSKASEAAASAAAAASAVQGQTTSKLELAAIDQTVFASTTLVDAVIYDTSKDSDGGAWRKRCQHTSWFNETIYGKWLGSAATEAAARAISGATTNDYYYDTAQAKFYTLLASSGRTEVFRGNAREFPARALITAEMSRVVIWDLTQPGSPMWMVFSYAQAGSQANHSIAPYNISSICAGYGRLCIACLGSGGYVKGLSVVEFALDSAHARMDGVVGSSRYYTGSIASRNSTAVGFGGALLTNIVKGVVNDIAMTVLPDAPIDPATGLPVPTIACATDGGVSVITHDGAVSTSVTGVAYLSVAFDRDGTLRAGASNSAYLRSAARGAWGTTGFSFSDLHNSTVPALLNGSGVRSAPCGLSALSLAMGTSGLCHLRDNPGAPTQGMVAYATKDYATGWLPGDIRGAWINRADGVSEALADTELVTNGGFDTDTTGWAPSGAGTPGVVESGRLKIAAEGNYGKQTQIVPVVVGKAYVLTADIQVGSSTGAYIYAGNAVNGNQYFEDSSGSSKTVRKYFVPSSTSLHITVRTGEQAGGTTAFFDNISVREVVADRSVKNIGLVVKGTLSRAPVAAGAGLTAISGFSADNYLECPYTSALDFGTGDFCVMGWVKMSAAPSATLALLFRGDVASGYFGLTLDSNGYARLGADDAVVSFKSATLSTGLADGSWHLLVAGVRAGSLFISADARAETTAAGGGVNVTDTTASKSLILGASALPGSLQVALWRVSATAPSADQIRHIYETERMVFGANAQCALAGTSNAVAALAYDEDTDLLHVGTSWGRSAFQGLVRVASEATPVGAVKALSASGGAVAQAGASSVDIYVPAYSLREEVERLDDAARALGSRPVFNEFDATTGQTAFVLPVGFRVIGVYSAGVLKRNGSTKDYTLAFDGFRWTVNFAVAPGNGAWVSIMTVRA